MSILELIYLLPQLQEFTFPPTAEEGFSFVGMDIILRHIFRVFLYFTHYFLIVFIGMQIFFLLGPGQRTHTMKKQDSPLDSESFRWSENIQVFGRCWDGWCCFRSTKYGSTCTIFKRF